jgi:hypothetical protein
MLLFAGCNDDCIAPCNNQRCKHTKVKYGKYTGDGVYTAKGMYVAKGKNSKYTKDSMYVAKDENAKYAEEATFAKKGCNEPLAKEGNNKPLGKDCDWAEYNYVPLATRAIGCVCHARQQ